MNAPLTSPVEGAPWQVSVPWARAWLDIPGWVDARGKPYGPRVLRGALLNALQLPGGMHSDFDGRDAAGKTLDRPAPICYRVRNGRPQVWLMGELAARAGDTVPALARAQLVRSWAALRVMTPDGLPIYQRSATMPGAFLVTCHSGITLAAAHALRLPDWLEARADAPDLTAFSEARFSL